MPLQEVAVGTETGPELVAVTTISDLIGDETSRTALITHGAERMIAVIDQHAASLWSRAERSTIIQPRTRWISGRLSPLGFFLRISATRFLL